MHGSFFMGKIGIDNGCCAKDAVPGIPGKVDRTWQCLNLQIS